LVLRGCHHYKITQKTVTNAARPQGREGGRQATKLVIFSERHFTAYNKMGNTSAEGACLQMFHH
jgi:hypothetical protein